MSQLNNRLTPERRYEFEETISDGEVSVGVFSICCETIMGVHVECYSGSRGDEEPRALWLEGERHEVMLVLERWLEPDCRCFKVQIYDARVWSLRQDVHHGEWLVTHLRPAGG